MSAGYSATPLIKKLGIKPGFRVGFVHAPAGYFDLLGELPAELSICDDLGGGDCDFVHAFFQRRADCEAEFASLKAAIKKDGMLWISWYKKASRMPTDISETVVRELALQGGLVDVKVAAVDAQWSGLKLVYRLRDR